MKRKIYREDIINAGLELMFLNGYSATGIKEITESVNIPKGSFYNHFANKEEFGLEVVKTYCDNGIKMYQNAFLNKQLPPIERVKSFFDRLITDYSEVLDFKLGCVMGNFSIEMSDINEKFQQLLDKEFDRFEAVITTCLLEAQEAGDLSKEKDPKQLAAFILNSWHGALLRMKSTGNSKPLEDCKNVVLDILLK